MSRRNETRPLHDAGFTIFDTFLDQVSDTVGRHPVETGGAILGDYTSGVITSFLFDVDAETTSVSYVPSRTLNRRVNEAEDESRLQFKGVLHSHPGNFDVPSGPDANSFWVGLDVNPELSRYLAPIVTFKPGPERDNKMPLPGGGWVTFYVALRDGRRNVRIERTMPDIIHFGRDCRDIAIRLGLPTPEFLDGDNGTVATVSSVIALTDDLELMLTADGSYPENPPRAILHRTSTAVSSQLNLRWSAVADPDVRLLRSLSETALAPDSLPVSLAYGTNGIPLTTDDGTAATLGLEPIFVGSDYSARVERIEEGLFARSKGLLSTQLKNCRVLVNGAGSVGSYVAEQLVRSGVGAVTLVDPDTVEYANLSRTNYTADDVGRLKIDALARRLLSFSPSLKIESVPANLHDIDQATLSRLFTEADFVVCAVDDRRAQLLINHFSYHHQRPAVYVGIYKGARSGEVCFVEPPLPCFDCATRFRSEVTSEGDRVTDYGTGQLVAEVALGVDIQAITAAGVRITLSRLVKDQESSLASFVAGMGKRQYAILGVDPNVDILDELMRDTPAQYGYRSIWVTFQRIDDCVVCGSSPIKPRATVQISATDIMDALRSSTPTPDGPAPNLTTPGDRTSDVYEPSEASETVLATEPEPTELPAPEVPPSAPDGPG